MTTALTRSPRATLVSARRDPRDLWPDQARKLYDHLVALYGEDDPLPTLAAAWIAHQSSVHTQKSYGRGFRVFEEFAREHGAHPMAVKFRLADTFRPERTFSWVISCRSSRSGDSGGTKAVGGGAAVGTNRAI
ncbi:hypothetical protein ACIRU5_35655 [Streptomyces misionensis]|uniref:hypothetical protein n=1 Tax=Streptomyces misionensis TaxID=67331 RepID=UPI003809F03F